MIMLELAPKKRKCEKCDQCDETTGVREYYFPYTPSGATVKHSGDGRYRDLCQSCQRALGRMPPLYITPSTELPQWGSARRAAGEVTNG